MQDFTSNKAKELADLGYFFNRAYYIQKALNLVLPHWKYLMGFTAIYLGSLLLLFVVNRSMAQMLQMIIAGPISAGYYLSVSKLLKGETIDLNSFIEGFNIFIPSMLVYMLVNLLTTLGFVLWIIPSLFIVTIYLFAMPLVVFDKLDFWKAMESSRIIIMRNFWEALIYILIILAINLLGIIALGIGVLFTYPLSYALVLVAYEDIYGLEQSTQTYHNDFKHFR